MIASLAFKVVEAENGGSAWVQVVVTMIVTFGVVVTAVLSYLGVRRAGAAKNEATETRNENRMDHGRVADALIALGAEITALKEQTGHRFDQLGQSIGDVREAHVRHLEWHVDKPRSTDS